MLFNFANHLKYDNFKMAFHLAMNPRNALCKTKYLFILSHMRSRSTLLSHILGSNPDICGYAELHRSYRGSMSLLKMRAILSADTKDILENKYLLDKILHNYSISKKIFELVNPKIIYLVRNPENTIKSIINMGRTTELKKYQDPTEATKYYCNRLSLLEEQIRKNRADFFFIDSKDLIHRTDHVLLSLQDWLKLKQPLSRYYKIFRNTGTPGYGDRSQKIMSGKISRTKGYPEINIPLDCLRDAESAYLNFRNAYSKRSDHKLAVD
jgi:hypothetical protein